MLDALTLGLVSERVEAGPLTDHIIPTGEGKRLRITTNSLKPDTVVFQEEDGDHVTILSERLPVSRIPAEIERRMKLPTVR